VVRDGEPKPLVGRRLALGLGLLAAGCGGGSGGGVIPAPGSVALADVQTQVFGPRCALSGCHIGPFAPFGLDLGSPSASAENLVGVASEEIPGLFRVEPYDAASSYLYMKLIDDPGISGDPMPLSGGPLGAADLALVESWIDQGAM